MKRVKEIIALLAVIVIVAVRCDELYELFHRGDPCVGLCDKSSQTFVNNDYEKSCCQRGCRFFNLVDLSIDGLVINRLNGSKDACESSCTEAYESLLDRAACTTGCDSMAQQRVTDLLSLLSVFYVEEGLDSNVLLMSLDVPENDIMTDPGLRKELSPGWWDTEGFKLPQTFIKTVPRDADTMGDYGGSSVNYGDSKQSISIPGSDWLQCASRHTGIPRWLLASAIAIAASAATWLCFIADRSIEVPDESTSDKQPLTEKLTIVVPDEEPLYKTPPPKYSEFDETNEVRLDSSKINADAS